MITKELQQKYGLKFIGESRFDIYNKEKEIIDLYINQKKAIREIMEKFNISAKPIIKILKTNKISRRKDAGYFKKGNKIGNLNKKLEVHKHTKEVTNLYTKEFKNAEKIAKIFNCSDSTILKILKENNVMIERTIYKVPTSLLISEYNNGASFRELAEKYKLTQNCIYLRLKRDGVKIRKDVVRVKIRPIDYVKIGKLQSITKKRLFAEGKLKSHIKGKRFEEFYGPERAEEIKSKIKEKRAKQITPRLDTKIELKTQGFSQRLGIKYSPHFFVKEIEHKYNCDIFIPAQQGISQNTIIETDGDYFHGNPEFFKEEELNKRQREQKQRDEIRTKELKEKGYRVIRLWENDIKKMTLEDFKEILYQNEKQNTIVY